MGNPPPRPEGDAIPAGMAASPQPTVTAPSGPTDKKKIAKIAGVAVVLIGGLGAGIYFGWPFLMGLFGGNPFATPDGTIKYVANGLADNKPQVLWEAMPASYKQTLNEELKKSMANTDPEVHAKSVAVLQKLTGVLRDKKPLIIETVNGLSQGAGGGLPPELTDNWDDIVGLLDILTKGKMADMDWVQNPNLGDMLADEGSEIMAMAGLEKLLDKGLQENVGRGPKSMMEVREGLRNIEVIIVSQTDSEATLKVVSKELSGDPDDAESGEFVMVRTEERWLPKEMVDAWDEGIDELKKEIQREIPISSMAERKMTEEEKNQILALLDVVDQALDSANEATNSQELTAAVMGAAGGVMGAVMAGGQDGGGGLGSLFGTGGGAQPPAGFPGTGFGTLPGNSKGKGKGKGGGNQQLTQAQRMDWTFGGQQRNLQQWKGQSAANVITLFGQPNPANARAVPGGGEWTYTNLKITDAEGNPHTAITFVVLNGVVSDIRLPAN